MDEKMDQPEPEEKRGRPTEYDPAICAKVEALGCDGASLCEIALELGIAWDTMSNWRKKHKEFSDAVTQAQRNSQGWWEKEGRKAVFADQKYFSSAGYSLQMRNRFKEDWSESSNLNVTGDYADELKKAKQRERNKEKLETEAGSEDDSM